MCNPCIFIVPSPPDFPAAAGEEGTLTAGEVFSQIPGKDLYSLIVNPFASQTSVKTWADYPQYCDPSLSCPIIK